MFNFTSYLIFPDQTFVIWLHWWFKVSQWYFIYPLAILHTSAWVIIKVGFFWKCTDLVQKRAARRKAAGVITVQSCKEQPTLYQRIQRFIIQVARKTYIGAKKTAHGKSVNSYSLFWIALTPLIQKVGDIIVGIRWQQFGWRGTRALCYGASIQTACFCLLYSIYGQADQKTAERIMLWILVPLGAIMLLSWLLKNGRKSA